MAGEKDELPSKQMPHVLLFPFPIQSHVLPMLKLAELLSRAAGLHVTFLNTEAIHRRFRRGSPAVDRLRFRTIPDGLPEDDPRPFLEFLDLEDSMRARSREPYRGVLGDPDGWPPVRCVVADAILPLALEVAEEMGIPVIVFRACSACSFWAYYCIPELVKAGELPLPEGADLDETVKGVAGMEAFLRRRDLPSFCRDARTTTDRSLQFQIRVAATATRGKALIL